VYEKVDLNKVLDEVKMDLADIISEKSATIEAHVLCDANVNPSQFRQVFSNLMTNALKFSIPDIAPHITITAEHLKGSEVKAQYQISDVMLVLDIQYCHIRFKDNGIGLEQQYYDKIFELFVRLHGKSEFPGTGIGLAIVKKIIDNHNGFITVTSTPNEGTCFDLFIPLIEARD
jgi:signal transduction histidine kinase